jgi:hypothetical protein
MPRGKLLEMRAALILETKLDATSSPIIAS